MRDLFTKSDTSKPGIPIRTYLHARNHEPNKGKYSEIWRDGDYSVERVVFAQWPHLVAYRIKSPNGGAPFQLKDLHEVENWLVRLGYSVPANAEVDPPCSRSSCWMCSWRLLRASVEGTVN